MNQEEYITVKARVYQTIRSNADKKPKQVLALLKERHPDVELKVLIQILEELS